MCGPSSGQTPNYQMDSFLKPAAASPPPLLASNRAPVSPRPTPASFSSGPSSVTFRVGESLASPRRADRTVGDLFKKPVREVR